MFKLKFIEKSLWGFPVPNIMDNNGFPRNSYKTYIKRKRYAHQTVNSTGKCTRRQKRDIFTAAKKKETTPTKSKFCWFIHDIANIFWLILCRKMCVRILFYRMSWVTATDKNINEDNNTVVASRQSPLTSLIWKNWKSVSIAAICWVDLNWW